MQPQILSSSTETGVNIYSSGFNPCLLIITKSKLGFLQPGVTPVGSFSLTGDKPAEEEERCQRVPGCADPAHRGGGTVFGLLGAGQAGQHRQKQAKNPHHDQIDGDVGLPRTVVQVHCPWWRQEGGTRVKVL